MPPDSDTAPMVLLVVIAFTCGIIVCLGVQAMFSPSHHGPPVCGPYAPPTYSMDTYDLDEVANILHDYNATGWTQLRVFNNNFNGGYEVKATCPLSIAKAGE